MDGWMVNLVMGISLLSSLGSMYVQSTDYGNRRTGTRHLAVNMNNACSE
jgi:hypothetical protein